MNRIPGTDKMRPSRINDKPFLFGLPKLAACAEDLGRLLQLYVAHADSSSAGPTQPEAQLLACDELGVAIPPIDGTTESRHLTTREMSETSTIDGAGMAASDAVNSNTAKHSGSAVFTI